MRETKRERERVEIQGFSKENNSKNEETDRMYEKDKRMVTINIVVLFDRIGND